MTAVWLLAAFASFCAGAAIGRLVALARTNSLLARAREEMSREVQYWQEAAERANAKAVSVARDAEAFAAGCRQGRDDVISIMPLLIAARERENLPRAVGDEVDLI